MKVKVIHYRIGRAPVVVEVDPGSLAALKRLIGGGHLQCIHVQSLGLDLWCDVDGVSKGLPHNRYIWEEQFLLHLHDHVVKTEGYHNVRGDFFLARSEGPEIAGVTDEDVKLLVEHHGRRPETQA